MQHKPKRLYKQLYPDWNLKEMIGQIPCYKTSEMTDERIIDEIKKYGLEKIILKIENHAKKLGCPLEELGDYKKINNQQLLLEWIGNQRKEITSARLVLSSVLFNEFFETLKLQSHGSC